MIVDAAEIGLHGEAFWGLSGYELQLQFRGAKQRTDGWYELGLFVAWHAAMFQRAEKLPPLREALTNFRWASQRGTKQDPQAQLHLMRMLSARLGVPLQRRGKGSKR